MPEPPVIILDGSLKIETDEPVDLDAAFCDLKATRPFRYNHRMDKGHKHIRYIVVKKNDKEIFTSEFNDKECRIEIFWEKPPEGDIMNNPKR